MIIDTNETDSTTIDPDRNRDVIIVGGSAAGLSAALMLGRSRRSVLVIDGGEPRNRFTEHMHGVLGRDATDPRELIKTGRQEIARYGVQHLTGIVRRVSDADDGLIVETAAGDRFHTRALVAASGLRDRLPEIPGLAERWGRTVLHCPYCHGWEVRDQRLGVLATSSLSLHQVQLVRQLSDRVTFFDNGLGLTDARTEARLRSREVEIVRAPVSRVLGDGDVITGVRTDDGVITPVDAIFTGGIPEPLDGYLAELALPRNDGPVGSFLKVEPTGRTGHHRIWAVGNLVEPGANVPISMSSGTMAGAMINAELVTQDFDAAVEAG